MLKCKQLEEIISSMLENNKKNLQYKILNKEELLKEIEFFGGNYDVRLDEKEFEENAFTVLISNCKNEKVFMFTLFLMPQDLYYLISVWEKIYKGLRKSSIDRLKKDLNENILLLGYARFSDDELKKKEIGFSYECIKVYTNLIKEIHNRICCSILVEPEGIFEIAKNKQLPEQIEIEELYERKLGMMSSGGNITKKLAVLLKLEEIKGFYNYYTLGPVFLAYK